MTLSPTEKALLLALHQGQHYRANPVKPEFLLATDANSANPAGRRLVKLGLAARVPDGARPGALLLRITDKGISEAEKLQEAQRRPTAWESIKALPYGTGAWDLLKIGFGAFLGALGTKYFG